MNNKLQQLVSDINKINTLNNPISLTWKISCHFIKADNCLAWLHFGEILSHHPEINSINAYHNQYHSAEAIMSAAYLLQEEFDSETCSKVGPILLLAMMFHDVGHNGKHNTFPYELETIAYHSLSDYVERNNYLLDYWTEHLSPTYGDWKTFKHILKEIILGTDFVHGIKPNSLNYKTNNDSFHLSQLKVLANEADTLASCILDLGYERGERLATEWNNTNINSNENRIKFLSSVKYTSDASYLLGINEHILEQIQQLQKTPSLRK